MDEDLQLRPWQLHLMDCIDNHLDKENIWVRGITVNEGKTFFFKNIFMHCMEFVNWNHKVKAKVYTTFYGHNH